MTERLNSPALAYVSVGSNIEPERYIEAALGLLMDSLSSRQVPKTIGMPMSAFSDSLAVKLGQE